MNKCAEFTSFYYTQSLQPMIRPTLFLLILLGSLASPVLAQIEVPEAAQYHLAKHYPEAQAPHWEYREGGLSAMFTVQHQLIKVFYEKSGQWRETRTRLSPTYIPQEVLVYMQTHFQNAFITYAGLVVSPSQRYYRIEAEYPDSVVIKLLTPKGDVMEEQRFTYSR